MCPAPGVLMLTPHATAQSSCVKPTDAELYATKGKGKSGRSAGRIGSRQAKALVCISGPFLSARTLCREDLPL